MKRRGVLKFHWDNKMLLEFFEETKIEIQRSWQNQIKFGENLKRRPCIYRISHQWKLRPIRHSLDQFNFRIVERGLGRRDTYPKLVVTARSRRHLGAGMEKSFVRKGAYTETEIGRIWFEDLSNPQILWFFWFDLGFGFSSIGFWIFSFGLDLSNQIHMAV